jgi:glycosyltransferase involved in cell wall biosynthesis
VTAPRVTLVMSVYNGERYLAAAIDSILRQTYREFTAIIIDDGSTDRSAGIVRSFTDPRMHMLRNTTNIGLAASLNRGLREATSEYVARLDADDECEPDRLEQQVAFLDAHPHVLLAGSGYSVIDESGAVRARHDLPCDDLELRWMMHFVSPFIHSALMWRRVPVQAQVGAYDETLRYSMDYDLVRRVARAGAVANVPASLVRLREHDDSMTATMETDRREGHAMRVADAARMLQWPASDRAACSDRFDAMVSVVRGRASGLSLKAIRQALADTLQLHERFSRESNAAAAALRRHGTMLRTRLARSFVALACERHDLREARQLFMLALRTDPAVLLRRRGLRAAVRLASGSPPCGSPVHGPEEGTHAR